MAAGVDEAVATIWRLIRALRRRRWLAVAIAWTIAIAAALVVSRWPDRYEATARIYVDTQTVLKPLLKDMVYQPDIDQQVRMLSRTLVSRPTLQRLVDDRHLGFVFHNSAERDATIDKLDQRIKVTGDSGNLYVISYRDLNPERARKFVESMVALFTNAGALDKSRDSIGAGEFIEDQIKANEAKLIAAENRLKAFKVRNFGVTGVSSQDYFGRMSTLSDEVAKLTIDLRAAEQVRSAYRQQLMAEDPQLPVQSLPGAPVLSEIDSRIEAQQKQLDDLLRNFTEQHPDVVNTRRVIAQLQLQKRKEAEARGPSGDSGTRGTAATSPIYQKIRTSLAESEAQVASLRSQLSAQQQRLSEVRSLAGRMPQVEAELAQLNRDYDVIRKNYDQLVARRESASLGVKLDESSQLADFRVVDPPRVSRSPVFPARLHLAILAVLFAAVAGIGMAIGFDMLLPTLDNTKSLEQLSGRPVLGVISLSRTQEWRSVARQKLIRYGSAVGLLLTFNVVWVAWIATRALEN